MAVLAQAAPAPKTTGEIAKVAKVPPAYLVKILQLLNRSGLVKSQKGIRGGVSLGKPASEITILEVVNAVDPIQRIRSCPLKLPSHSHRLCGLHSRLDEALASVEAAFSQATLKDVIEPSKSKPACPFPKFQKA
jgi:Rrf2 family protein